MIYKSMKFSTYYEILNIIKNHQPITMSNTLRKTASCSLATINIIMAKFEEQGLIKKVTIGRHKNITLTASGEKDWEVISKLSNKSKEILQ